MTTAHNCGRLCLREGDRIYRSQAAWARPFGRIAMQTGECLLMAAFLDGQADLMRLLLSAGANPNAIDPEVLACIGSTPARRPGDEVLA